MKILYVIDSLGAGGAERSTAALLPVLREKGADVAVATLYRAQEGSEQEVRDAGISVHRMTAEHLPGRVRELRRLIRAERPDVVHTALFAADVAGRVAAAGTPAAVVSSLTNVPRARRDGRRGSLPWKLRVVDAVDTVTARLFTARLHAVTAGVARLTEEEHPLLRGRVSVVERGRSAEVLGKRSEHRRAGTRVALGLDDDTPVLLAIGRQEHQKAHVDLIAALEVLVERVPNAQLLIAGRRGIASSTIEAMLSERADLAAHVHMLGHRSDIGDLLVAADVMVSSSLHEGAAGVVIEAMALSTPIVSTEVEGLEGVLAHEVNALLVPIRDPSAMAGAIERLLRDRALGARLAEHGRRDFEDRFTIERSADRMLELYADVIASTRRRRRRRSVRQAARTS